VRIAWVHPSWRDLVIARLAEDGVARRRFLGRCGIHGVVLALSTGGGATGDGALPLLSDDDDWDVLTDRAYALVGELEPGELLALLAALGAAIDGLEPDGRGREARALAETVLARTASLWRAAGRPIGLGELGAWFELAARIRPRPPLPTLGVTWAELLPTHAPAPLDRLEVERFTDWLMLCRMLGEYDGRLRPDLGVEATWALAASGFLASVEADLSMSPGQAGTVARALSAIADVFPSLSERAFVLERLLALRHRVDDPGLMSPVTPVSELVEEPREMQGFDVHRVLADL
jgi:hypothetical protein